MFLFLSATLIGCDDDEPAETIEDGAVTPDDGVDPDAGPTPDTGGPDMAV